jgi:hypothetical protein
MSNHRGLARGVLFHRTFLLHHKTFQAQARSIIGLPCLGENADSCFIFI